MPEIRLATLADVPDIVRLGLRFLRESSFAAAIAENPAQMAQFAIEIIGGVRDGVIYMAEGADGRPVGMVGGLHYVHPISGEAMVTELFWYAEPEACGTRGVRLLKALERWTVERGAAVLQMIAPIGADRVTGLYQALRYTPVEVAWQKRVGA